MKHLAKAIGGGSAPKEVKVAAPKEPEPTPLPDPEEERRAAIRNELARRKTGRASTLLSDDDSDKL